MVFPLLNAGDRVSDGAPYAVLCKVLCGGGGCPFAEKPGTLAPVPAGGRGEIRLKGLIFPAGDYELTLRIADGSSRTVKLKVVAARAVPATMKGTPKQIWTRPRRIRSSSNDRPIESSGRSGDGPSGLRLDVTRHPTGQIS